MRLTSSAFVVLTSVATTAAQPPDPEGLRLFTGKVRPVLAASCYSCHSAQAKPLKAGLRLDTRDGLRRGGTSGPIVEPGRPDDSLLVRALEHTSEIAQMPPNGKLPDAAISAIRRWIELGAPHPDDAKAPPLDGGARPTPGGDSAIPHGSAALIGRHRRRGSPPRRPPG